MVKVIWIFLRSFPIDAIFWKAYCKLFGIKIPQRQQWLQLAAGKKGIEIGGPSGIFDKKGYLPIYPVIKSLDGVNFDKNTVWEGSLTAGENYQYGQKTGYQFIAEGSNIAQVSDNSYECVLSSNNLEHFANPLKALFEWQRILKPGGCVILVLPNKKVNFDHRRPYTPFEHILADYQNNTPESDLTHVAEVLRLHDFSRDPQAGGPAKFEARCRNNIKYRCLHHHVYSQALLKKLLEYVGMHVTLQHTSKTDHYIAAIKK